MLFSSDNIFIVTGATSGIGKKLVYILNSLNASVSAGIAMYEVIRQRNFKN